MKTYVGFTSAQKHVGPKRDSNAYDNIIRTHNVNEII